MVIKNAKIVNFDGELEADVLIKNGVIEKIGFISHDDEIIDGEGLWLLPGLVDLNGRVLDDRINQANLLDLHKKALQGGATTLALMPDTTPKVCDEITLEFVRTQSHDAHILPYIMALKSEEQMSEISILLKKGAQGVYTPSDINPYLLARVFEYAKMHDIPLFVEPKNSVFQDIGVMNESEVSFRLGLGGIGKLPEIAEVAKVIEYSEEYGVTVLFKNVSTAKSLERIAKSRRCFAEVSIHHLVLSDEACADYNTEAKIFPPLREEDERQELLMALQKGKIDLLTALHSPKSRISKGRSFNEAAFGIDAIAYYLPLLYTYLVKTDIIKPTKMVELTSTNPSCFVGKKLGKIEEGYIADLVLFDPDKSTTIDSSLYPKELEGKVVQVIKGGRSIAS